MTSKSIALGALVLSMTVLSGCGNQEGQAKSGSMVGAIKLDGSSTVYPIAEAVAEEFDKQHPRVKTTIGRSGSGGGFKQFVEGRTDISNASRPIKMAELEKTTQNDVEFVEVPIAYDGLSIVVNKSNTFVDQLTVEELRTIFQDGDRASNWSDVRDGWPEMPIKIFMPGADSGTFDYFKEVVVGKKSIRSDVSASEDDNVIVKGVSGEKGAIGFFGCAYYFENKGAIRAIPILNPVLDEAVMPTAETIESGKYAPFSRPLFIYVNKKSLETKPQVAAFVDYFLGEGNPLVSEVGYVQLPSLVLDRAKANVENRRTGTQYLSEDGEKLHGPVTELYQ